MLKQYKFWIFINLFIVEIDTHYLPKMQQKYFSRSRPKNNGYIYWNVIVFHVIGGSFREELQS